MASIDRSFARMIAIKRIITGSLSIACGVGLTAALVWHATATSAPTPGALSAVGLLIFFGGGAWTLRDGLRLRRELAQTR